MADLIQAADYIIVGAIVTVAALFAAVAVLGALAVYTLARHLRRRRCTHIPPAPDNQAGHDTHALETCHRIHAISDHRTEKP